MQLQRDLPLLRDAGWGLAAISYDSAPVLKEFAARKQISFPLLSDYDSRIIRAYGVANREYRPGTQLDVEREIVYQNTFDNVPVYGLAYPAVFAINPSGTIQWRYVSLRSELRLTGAAILAESAGMPATAVRRAAKAGNIEVAATASNSYAGLGNRLVLGVEVKLPPGVHVYSPQVSSEYRGIAWTLEKSDCWEAGAADYPAATLRRFPFSEEELPVYEGTVALRRELVIKPILRASDPTAYQAFRALCIDPQGNIKLSGALQFQACDDRQCFPPQSVPLGWSFRFDPLDRQRSPLDLRREFDP